jgi:hypothetical protein
MNSLPQPVSVAQAGGEPQATREEIQRLILIEFAGQIPESRRAAERIWNLIDARAKTLARRGTTSVLPLPEGQGKECDGVSRCSAGCGTPGCTDPNCDYGKGLLRCQSCGAPMVVAPQPSAGSVCCYCDAPLCCAACGREQPDDSADLPQEAWQSIATAPKDGPAFLVWVPENLCIYEVIARDGNLSIFGGGFRDNIHRATHWIPLPTPPVTRPQLGPNPSAPAEPTPSRRHPE